MNDDRPEAGHNEAHPSSHLAEAANGKKPWLNAVIAAATAFTLVITSMVFFLGSTRSNPAQADSVIDGQNTTDPEPLAAEPAPDVSPAGTEPAVVGSLSDIKNVAFILADDLDWALFEQIPRLSALKDEGMTFTNHTVTDSLCCPSRVSIMRGQYIHNHKVISNIEETGGGWPTFRDRKQEKDCLPVWLSNSGVTTALFGKYLNDFPSKPSETTYVPPGWDQWGVPISRGDSYTGYNYVLNDNGKLKRYGNQPTDFLNDVITDKATDFIGSAKSPFFLELSTYSPHKPAPVAQRNRFKQSNTVVPRTPNYNAFGVDEPKWMRDKKKLSPRVLAKADQQWRKRARSAESVADSVDAVMNKLKETGHDKDTLLVVTTDNGYHMVERRMFKGKRTPFASDTVVPMIVIGPGVPAGVTVNEMTSTIDLAPTFTDILGARSPNWVDGRSVTGFFDDGIAPENWRNAALSESLGISTPEDPDYQKNAPPQFFALRTPQWLYVEYADGSRTLYNRETDPYEARNVIKTTDPLFVKSLSRQLKQLSTCSGDTCRVADTVDTPMVPLTN